MSNDGSSERQELTLIEDALINETIIDERNSE
jgi:hypothetical protein